MNLPRHCPQCGSTDLVLQTNQNVHVEQSGFDLLYACIGTLITGPIGLLCGLCGMGDTRVTATVQVGFQCNACGCQFAGPNGPDESNDS